MAVVMDYTGQVTAALDTASLQTGLPTFLDSSDKQGASVSGVWTLPDLSLGPTENAAEGKLCNETECSELFIAVKQWLINPVQSGMLNQITGKNKGNCQMLADIFSFSCSK